MKELRRPYLHSSFLPPEMVVDRWRILGRQGRGTYGTVYRAEEVGREHAGPVAFKIAVYEGDPRFKKEVGLLGRIHHPSVPGLLGYGEWRASPGVFYPYVVMARRAVTGPATPALWEGAGGNQRGMLDETRGKAP
jgi:hypothetical protein